MARALGSVGGLRPARLAAGRGVHPVDSFAPAFARAIRLAPGETALDLGCGSGYYGLDLARRGAGRVCLTDLDPAAVACARGNARRLGLIVEARAGDFFRPVPRRRFDVVVANLPQCPAPRPIALARWGGRDGLRHLRRLAREAPRHLRPGGRLYFLATGWVDGPALRRAFARRFSLRPVARVHRAVGRSDYERLCPGLFEWLLARIRPGAGPRERDRGRLRLALTFYEATLRPPPDRPV